MIRAGRLRERIVIQRPDRQFTDTGNWNTVRVTIIETFCDVSMVSGDNEVLAGHNELIQSYNFTFRHRPDKAIRKGDILFWRERQFKIHSFQWDILRTKLTIIAYTDTRDTLTDWDNINTENQQQNVYDEPIITEQGAVIVEPVELATEEGNYIDAENTSNLITEEGQENQTDEGVNIIEQRGPDYNG